MGPDGGPAGANRASSAMTGETMSKLWRYKRDGQVCGPVTSADLRLLADSGALLETDQVCKEGTKTWMPASAVRGLFERDDKSTTWAQRFQEWAKVVYITVAVVALATAATFVGIVVYRHMTEPGPDQLASTPGDTARPKHLLAALHAMREARAELRDAADQDDRRIEKARFALKKAIEQTERALRAAGMDTSTEAPHPDALKKYRHQRHPQLSHALSEIMEARAEIKAADHDFGGERERTLHELREAADYVERALKSSGRDREPSGRERGPSERERGPSERERRHEPLHEAMDHLREARPHFRRDNPRDQVDQAHRKLERAIQYVKGSQDKFGDRRGRLLERLERLDRELRENPGKADKILAEALEDLEFATRH
jgi:hypothetical protein